MLSPEFYETAPIEITRLMSTTEAWLVQEIARKIKSMDEISGSSEYELKRLMSIRQFDMDYKEAIAALSERTIEEIEDIYKRAAIEAHSFDKELFEAKGVPFIEFKDNKWLQQLTKAYAENTGETFENLTRTIGFITKDGGYLSANDYYTKKLGEFSFMVTSGAVSYNTAIRQCVNEMVKSGIRVIEYPKASPRSIESVVRANILTGVTQLANQVEWENIKALGATVVETTAHFDSRPSHVPWQGRRFSLGGSVTEILQKVEEIREKGLQSGGDGGIIEPDDETMARKTANTGIFAHLSEPMQKRHVLKIAEKYGIDLSGITVKIQRDESLVKAVFCGSADPKNIGRIDLFPSAFSSEIELARTIFHEKLHAEQFEKYGSEYVMENQGYFENITRAAENEYFDKQGRGK